MLLEPPLPGGSQARAASPSRASSSPELQITKLGAECAARSCRQQARGFPLPDKAAVGRGIEDQSVVALCRNVLQRSKWSACWGAAAASGHLRSQPDLRCRGPSCDATGPGLFELAPGDTNVGSRPTGSRTSRLTVILGGKSESVRNWRDLSEPRPNLLGRAFQVKGCSLGQREGNLDRTFEAVTMPSMPASASRQLAGFAVLSVAMWCSCRILVASWSSARGNRRRHDCRTTHLSNAVPRANHQLGTAAMIGNGRAGSNALATQSSIRRVSGRCMMFHPWNSVNRAG